MRVLSEDHKLKLSKSNSGRTRSLETRAKIADSRRRNIPKATQVVRSKAGRSSSGYKGVYRKGDKWQVKINLYGKDTSIGLFADKEEAARHYDYYMLKHYGNSVYLNFPSQDYSDFKPREFDRTKTRGKLCFRKAEEIRIKHGNGVDSKRLAEEYSVSLTTVYNVLNIMLYRPRDFAEVSVIYNPH